MRAQYDFFNACFVRDKPVLMCFGREKNLTSTLNYTTRHFVTTTRTFHAITFLRPFPIRWEIFVSMSLIVYSFNSCNRLSPQKDHSIKEQIHQVILRLWHSFIVPVDQLYFAAAPQSDIIFAFKLRAAQYNSPQANITERNLIW